MKRHLRYIRQELTHRWHHTTTAWNWSLAFTAFLHAKAQDLTRSSDQAWYTPNSWIRQSLSKWDYETFMLCPENHKTKTSTEWVRMDPNGTFKPFWTKQARCFQDLRDEMAITTGLWRGKCWQGHFDLLQSSCCTSQLLGLLQVCDFWCFNSARIEIHLWVAKLFSDMLPGNTAYVYILLSKIWSR